MFRSALWAYTASLSIRRGRENRQGLTMWRRDDALKPSRGGAGLVDRTRALDPVKAWGVAIAKRRGMQKAIVAVGCKLAIVLHRMWRDQTEFRWTATA